MGERLQQLGEVDSYQQVRLLAEVDLLNNNRLWDGTLDPVVVGAVRINLQTAVQEAAMPYAITPTFRPYVNGEYMWGHQTSVQVAESGTQFYQSPEGYVRKDIEVDEAIDARDNLVPGLAKILVSPRMTPEDAPEEVARTEHLADDDAVRISYLGDEDGAPGMRLQSLLIRDIPLPAWIALANDPQGLFKGQVHIPEVNSALPIMRAHREMHIPLSDIPEGVLSVVAATIPYIADAETRSKVEKHLSMFRAINQQEAAAQADSVAMRWQAFELELAESLHSGYATEGVKDFIASVSAHLKTETRALLAEQLQPDGQLAMTRALAADLEAARRNTLWSAAAVLAGNEEVLKQLSAADARKIRENELFIQTVLANGYNSGYVSRLEAEQNRLIAANNISVGRGCPGESANAFERERASEAAEDKDSGPKEEKMDLNGKIRCIKCREYVPKRQVVKKTCWQCPKCNHKVDICSGAVLQEGKAPQEEMATRAEALLKPLAVNGLREAIEAKRMAPRQEVSSINA